MQYQIADGRLITSLSREELINELAKAMEAIEKLSDINESITNIIAAWREDRT